MKTAAKFRFQTGWHPSVISADGDVVVATDSDSTQCVILDGRLRELQRLGPYGHMQIESVALSPKSDSLAIALKDRLIHCNVDAATQGEYPLQPWNHQSGGHPAFSDDGQFLWYADPRDSIRRPTIHVVDTKSTQIVATQVVEVPEDSYLSFTFHPAGRPVALVAGAGQDGQWTYFCELDGSLRIRRIDALGWRPLDCFHPRGHEFISSSLMDGIVERRRIPDSSIIADLVCPDDVAARCCSFVSDTQLVMAGDPNDEELVLIDYQSMSVNGRIHPEYQSGDDDTYISEIQLLGPDRLLAVHYALGGDTISYTLRLWDAPEILPTPS